MLLAKTGNDYHVAAISEGFVRGAPIHPNGQNVLRLVPDRNDSTVEQLWLESLRVSPVNLIVHDCITNCSQTLLSEYGNVALVMDWQNSSNALLLKTTFQIPSYDRGLFPGWTVVFWSILSVCPIN